MKERQRWQPEEDALLRAYVKQYGPKEWSLVSQRMNNPLDRDPKSCLERWKNYLKPGIKKGSLTPEEQSLVISLQAKYGNKWKKIAAEVPGRTAKRLGKWWEVFKEKQLKQLQKSNNNKTCRTGDHNHQSSGSISSETAAPGKYDHILETFAEKYVQSSVTVTDPASSSLPPWMISTPATNSSSSSTSTSLTLSSPSDPAVVDPVVGPVTVLVQHCRELEEGKESWLRHKKEATWRLNRLEQQLESEKARRRREKTEEIEAKIQLLREEEVAFVSRMEGECREELNALQREAEAKEARLMEAWCCSHLKMMRLVQQIGAHHGSH